VIEGLKIQKTIPTPTPIGDWKVTVKRVNSVFVQISEFRVPIHNLSFTIHNSPFIIHHSSKSHSGFWQTITVLNS